AITRHSEAPAKRYRYTGMERDEESGLSYHTARYYATWLGRWGSCDPKGIIEGLNVFEYCSSNPIIFFDSSGTAFLDFDAWADRNQMTLLADDQAVSVEDASKNTPDDSRATSHWDEFTWDKYYGGEEDWRLSDWTLKVPSPNLASMGRSKWLAKNYFAAASSVVTTWDDALIYRMKGTLAAADLFAGMAVWMVSAIGAVFIAGLSTTLKKIDEVAPNTVEALSIMTMQPEFRMLKGMSFSRTSISGEAAAAEGRVAVWSKASFGTEVRKLGGMWVKRVDPNASQFMQWWGRKAIQAQAEGLAKLGNLATAYRYENGLLLTQDVGPSASFLSATYWRSFYEGTKRMGTLLHDIRPANVGSNGLIFDPALDPLSKGILIGVPVTGGLGYYKWSQENKK
ncbi:MAG: RHS repeat-associated core domain-containing protein, partial [Cyanobacteria bacterium]|nr:RHS repeat-associated core domain-containing protein [Cyanobacteriota bacterium]